MYGNAEPLEERDPYGFADMDLPTGGPYQLKELKAKHREVIRLAASGMKYTEIAEELKLTPTAVSYIVRGELGQAHLEGIEERADIDAIDVRAEIARVAPRAVEFLRKIVEGSVGELEGISPKDRMKASQDMLDRAGHGKVQIVRNSFQGYAGLETLKERARRIGVETGNIIDVTPSPSQSEHSELSRNENPGSSYIGPNGHQTDGSRERVGDEGTDEAGPSGEAEHLL